MEKSRNCVKKSGGERKAERNRKRKKLGFRFLPIKDEWKKPL
jgi:hypothetical protein